MHHVTATGAMSRALALGGQFSALGVASHVYGKLANLGFKAPSGVQREVIPAAIAGKHDLVVHAETGGATPHRAVGRALAQ